MTSLLLFLIGAGVIQEIVKNLKPFEDVPVVSVETKDENKKEHICKVFEADIELFDSNTTDIDTLILQCAEDFTKCLFYYDCNPFDMETKTFMKCVENM